MPRTLVSLLILACLLQLLAAGCADPTTAYHRQFTYLTRTGGAALAAGRVEAAHRDLGQAAELAGFAAASDLEYVDVVTRLSEASRRIGRGAEARARMKTGGRILARIGLKGDRGGATFRRVAGSYALESARLEALLGDLGKAEAMLTEFFAVRGNGGDAAQAAEAHWLLGELYLGRDLVGHARSEFSQALELARDRKDLGSVHAMIHLRAAEGEAEQGRVAAARQLVEAVRPDGATTPELHPGVLLVLARIDIAEGDPERAKIRLEEALEAMTADGVVGFAAPAQAASVSSLLFDAQRESAELFRSLDRSVALAGTTPPLGAVLLGRALIAAGRDLMTAGQRELGLRALDRGRKVIGRSLGDERHFTLDAADFEIAKGLVSIGRLDLASKRCEALREGTAPVVDRIPHLVVCGRIAARSRDAKAARESFGAALSSSEESRNQSLEFEMLVRLAAVAHAETESSMEANLFERALPLLSANAPRLPELLEDAYAHLGPGEATAAAERFAHAADRTPYHAEAAAKLKTLAAGLRDAEAPARLR